MDGRSLGVLVHLITVIQKWTQERVAPWPIAFLQKVVALAKTVPAICAV